MSADRYQRLGALFQLETVLVPFKIERYLLFLIIFPFFEQKTLKLTAKNLNAPSRAQRTPLHIHVKRAVRKRKQSS